MKSWKTTLFGIFTLVGGAFLGGVEMGVINLADFPHWAKGVAWLLTAIGGGGVGVTARDNNRSSEQVGAGNVPPPESKDQLKLPITLMGLCLALSLTAGCAHVVTHQHEVATDGTVRDTDFGAWTFFDSRNELSKARTTMTDKSQGVAIAGLDQEASGTNAVSLLEKVVSAAVTAAAKSAVP